MAALGWTDRFQQSERLVWSVVGAVGLSAVLVIAGWMALARRGQSPTITWMVRREHWVQACLHTSIFVYWSTEWPQVGEYALLIVSQLLFVHAFDAGFSYLRGEPWRLGFGRFPIILSTNLFMWFQDDVYFLQYAMVAVGVLGKAWLVWDRDGVRRHIFNPSAFSLSVTSLMLIVTGTTDWTHGPAISNTLGRPEFIYLWIFGCGLVVQGLFRVTLVTLCAGFSIWALGSLYFASTGVYFFLTSEIPIAVFLGLHLLVTDPSTSPKSDLGRGLFGALYGASVVALFALLDAFGQPTFYDKMLCVPVLNLSVRWIDRLAARLETAIPERLALPPARANATYMTVWIAFFGALYATGTFAPDHPSRDSRFWETACQEERLGACGHLDLLLSVECENGQGIACAKLGAFVYRGVGMPSDTERGAALVARGCDLGFQEACRRLSEFRPTSPASD